MLLQAAAAGAGAEFVWSRLAEYGILTLVLGGVAWMLWRRVVALEEAAKTGAETRAKAAEEAAKQAKEDRRTDRDQDRAFFRELTSALEGTKDHHDAVKQMGRSLDANTDKIAEIAREFWRERGPKDRT